MTLTPPPLVRLAGLPASVLAQLRFSDTSALVTRLLAEQEWLAKEGGGLSSSLHEVIGATADSTLRPRLVGLRRAVYGVRRPTAAEWSQEIQDAIPFFLTTRIRRWVGRLLAWRDDLARLPETLAGESRRQADVLLRVAAEPAVRRALVESSSSLTDQLDRWLVDPSRTPRRQALFRLAKYVARAATKTSPTSTFAVSGLAAWTSDGPVLHLNGDSEYRGVLELYGGLRDDVVDALVSQPTLREAATVRINPSVVRRNGRLTFLGRPPAEPLLTLPATAAVSSCLDLIGSRGPLALRELRTDLAKSAAAGLEEVSDFLSYLVEVGLLEISPPMVGRAPTAVQLADWVHSDGGDALTDVAKLLTELAAGLDDPVPVQDVTRHRIRRQAIRETVDALSSRLDLGRASGSSGDLVAHDSVVCIGPPAWCGTEAWREVVYDLGLIRRWLAVFDPALPLKLALSEVWRTRFAPGARVPFLDLYRAVHEEAGRGDSRAAELQALLSGDAVAATTESSTVPQIRELRQLRERALMPLRSRSTSIWHVEPAILAEQATEWPPWVEPIGSLSYDVQPLTTAEGPGLVVANTAGLGYGRGRTRVAHHLALAGAEPELGPLLGPDPAEPGSDSGPVLAELAGAHRSSLSDRAPGLSYEIDYPFAGSAHPSPRRLPMHDLCVVHDPVLDLLRLHSNRLGREVRALYLGLLMIPALPPAARLLVQAFGGAGRIPLFLPVWRPTSPPGVRRSPRVVVGRVVLRRASWVVDPAAIPKRLGDETDADYLMRLAGWRRATGIPTRCFVRATAMPEAGYRSFVMDKTHKPVYVDFENWFLVLAFENMLRATADVVAFEELLPDPELADEANCLPRAAELAVEVGQGAGL